MKAIEDDCRDLKSTLPKQLREVRNDLIKTLKDQTSSDLQESPGFDHSLSHIQQQLQAVQSMLTEIPLQHRILRHLIADNTHSRRNQIIDANPNTCRWILEDSEDDLEASENDSDSKCGSSLDFTSDVDSVAGSVPIKSWASTDSDWEAELQHRCEIRSRFIDWLATGQDVLHLSGNAGSGKSTLIKFIAQHKRTREELEAWAGTKRLILCHFYFWAAGTESQQSMPGLYRSLLFQTLSQCPELIETVFREQVKRMRRSGAQADPAVERVQAFDDTQVQDAFKVLLKQAHDADFRICFLLDGLDEFKGGRLEHENLAIQLKSWTLDGNVKLLVSSRPWPEFESVFTANTAIYLHELNHFDIRTYCSQKLREDRAVLRLRNDQRVSKFHRITSGIVNQSQGIFLWAHLVLDRILQGIRQGDSITTLEAKIREYPADLDGLYDKLREPIEKSLLDSNRANRMLLLAVNAPHKFYLPVIAFSWIHDGSNTGLLDPEFPTDNECRSYSYVEATKRIQRVIEQIKGLTRGLLELDQSRDYKDSLKYLPLNTYFTSPGVRFCHRSAYDYLVSNEARYQKVWASWPNFEDTDVYGRIHLARLLYGARSDPWPSTFNNYLDCGARTPHSYCKDFDPKTIRKFEAPLRPLLRGKFRGHVDIHCPTIRTPPSFLQWCAWCGLDTFVFAEANEPLERLHSVGSSILLAFIDRETGIPEYDRSRLRAFLQLLNRRIGIDVMVEIWVWRADSVHLPVWVVAYWLLFQNLRFDRDPDPEGLLVLESLRCLQKYGEQVGERMSLTLGLVDAGSRSVQAERQFRAAEIVDWLEEWFCKWREKFETYRAADQARWLWSARTANVIHSTGGMMQHTLGKWLEQDKRCRSWEDLRILGLHWGQIDGNTYYCSTDSDMVGFRLV